ncbi:MAG TPA: hypothetical protein VK821_11975 [Dehalococcoidia bacterium]|nr:hypothetical protein [Dehalococcoidia bacterium]
MTEFDQRSCRSWQCGGVIDVLAGQLTAGRLLDETPHAMIEQLRKINDTIGWTFEVPGGWAATECPNTGVQLTEQEWATALESAFGAVGVGQDELLADKWRLVDPKPPDR